MAIVGASGNGKTTLARALAERLGIPHVELDALHHGPNWQAASAEELHAKIEERIRDGGWVVDGNYHGKIGDLVVRQSDTIVWLDLPLPLLLRRLARRTAHRIRNRTELWNGNRETLRNAIFTRESLFAWTVRQHVRARRLYPGRFAALAHPNVVRLRSPGEVRAWLARQ